MKRIFYLIALALFFIQSFPALAQDKVAVKTSVREDYVRLTFSMGRDVPYKVDDSAPDKVVLTFEKAASADLAGADFGALKTISPPQVVSENPLKLSFPISPGSKVRSFDAKGKLFLDVYNKPGEKNAVKPAPDVVAKAEEKPVEPVKKDVQIKLEPETPPPPVVSKSKMPATPPKDVAQEKLPAPGQEKKDEGDKHIVSLTSTSAVEMAAFENAGSLWFVIDQDSFHLMPNIDSPTPDIFGAVEKLPIERGMVFRVNRPKDFEIRGQGGALLWSVILGSFQDKVHPIDLTRDVPADLKTVRGGKLLWPVKDVGPLFDVPDPATGQNLKVVTVKDAAQFSGPFQSFVDFDVLPSPIGLAIRPKVDDLIVEKTAEGIEISRPGGLALTAQRVTDHVPKGPAVDLYKKGVPEKPEEQKQGGNFTKKPSIFHFSEWKIGALEELNANKNAILTAINEKPKPRKIEELMTLSKMHLAHGRGAEALGFLEFAREEMPELEDNPEFRALRGVARAFDWKSDIAFGDLSHEDLKPYDEIGYWKSFVLADLGDWQQAAKVLPTDYGYLYDYPQKIGDRLALTLAEVNLRDGKVKTAEQLLEFVEKNNDDTLNMKAAIQYLRGELERQKGDKLETEKLWKELTENPDDFYRARAGLALARLLKDQGKITDKEVIDRLERLRYAWRGDELEAQINYWLGHAYFQSYDYVKGLSIMKDASAISANTILGQRIAKEMRDVFKDIFLKARLKDVTALDAVAMYEQFADLMPPGDEGNKITQVLAERLVKSDFLERAANLLQNQVDHKLQGEEKLRIAIRLAAIDLMDKQPQKAMKALGAAVDTMKSLPDDETKTRHQREIMLLSAKAYAQDGQGDEALALLKQMPKDADVSRLMADIAWQSGYWPDAAQAFEDVIAAENISMTRPLTPEQEDLIMNRAIALNLANDRISLANLREKYNDLMLQSTRANQFELISRTRRDSELADKDTLLSVVSEVDLFKNFLDSYRQSEDTVDVPATAPAPAAEKPAETKPEEQGEAEKPAAQKEASAEPAKEE